MSTSLNFLNQCNHVMYQCWAVENRVKARIGFSRFLSKERVERNRAKNTPSINRKRARAIIHGFYTVYEVYIYVPKYAVTYHEK